eukprot:16442118-Heterocapsa_arctica.AAC.1
MRLASEIRTTTPFNAQLGGGTEAMKSLNIPPGSPPDDAYSAQGLLVYEAVRPSLTQCQCRPPISAN